MFMTPESVQADGDCYIVPGRMLRGSRAEMLAELEEAVEALMALRLVILSSEAAPQSSAAAKRYPTHGSVRR
jgi:hypothetical protein